MGRGTRLSHRQKMIYYPLILKRDGNCCFYCKKEFSKNKILLTLNPKQKRIWEHLNNKETDSRLENLVFAHEGCNEKKKTDFDMQLLADAKLADNEKDAEFTASHHNSTKATSAEMDSNSAGLNMTYDYLDEQLQSHNGNPPIETKLRIKDVCDLLAGRLFKLLGHGSQETIRRHIDILTTEDWEFFKFKEGEKWWVGLSYEKDDV